VQQLDRDRRLSEQDYGPYLEVATLFEHEGRFFLYMVAGYDPEGDNAWYELSERPAKPLSDVASDGWLNPLADTSLELSAVLGVRATKCSRPT